MYLSEENIAILQRTGSIELTGKGGILLKILKNHRGLHGVTVKMHEKLVGLMGTSDDGRHDVIDVLPDFRKQGIGELMWSIKTSLDGCRLYEWSEKYSRIRFLIRHGYYPIGTLDSIDDTHTPLSREERRQLGEKIHHLPARDEADKLYYFKRAPIRALLLGKYLKKP